MVFKISFVLSSRIFFLKVSLLLSIFLILVFLDIPIARQAFGFLFLLFIPGLILLRLLNLKSLDILEKILLSVGLSLSFLMIFGLLINHSSSIIGFSSPLSEIPLITVLSGALLLLSSLISYKRKRERSFQIWSNLKSIVSAPLTVPFLCLPILGILGTVWTNVHEDNSLLLFMLVTIALLFVAGLSRKLLPSRLYPLAIVAIALSLIFHRSLVSDFVLAKGSDIYAELALFRITKTNAYWQPVLERVSHVLFARYNDMLSITILPTVFSSLLNVNPTWVFKLLYPSLFSFLPLALYQLWKRQLRPRIAFIATFLFMAQQTFYTEMLGLGRQMIAELFFCLLFLIVINDEIESSKKIVCFTIFSFSLIVSHYALSIIFALFISFAWVSLLVMKRRRKYTSKITSTMVVLFWVLMFLWYIYSSNAATFDSVVQFGNFVYSQLGSWADPLSRGTIVLRGLGMEASPSIWNSFSRGFAYLVQFLIFVGFVGLVLRRKKSHVSREFIVFSFLTMICLAGLILVPGLARTLNMTRFYHILLFFLAPLGALGAQFLVHTTLRRKTEIVTCILLAAVLTPYFLFQTNLIYEIAGSDSWSVSLSKYRMSSFRLYVQNKYIDQQSASGARWLSENIEIDDTTIYADVPAQSSSLTYFGITLTGNLYRLSNATIVAADGIVYMNRYNTLYGRILGKHSHWNSSELSFLKDLDIVYSNGDCDIYRAP